MEPGAELAQGSLALTRFRRTTPGNTRVVQELLIISAALSLVAVLVYLALLLWAAREDGRDQARRNYLRGR